MSQEVYIADAIRTPIGNFGGTLSAVRPDDMGAIVMKELMKRNPSIDPSRVEDVIFGVQTRPVKTIGMWQECHCYSPVCQLGLEEKQ